MNLCVCGSEWADCGAVCVGEEEVLESQQVVYVNV